MEKEAKKYNYHPTGLTEKEVKERREKNLVNTFEEVKTRTIPQIIFMHVFTLFNFLNFLLGFFVFLTGSFKNLLFLGVVICNILIGIIQEIRSKIIIDKLSIIASNKVKVLRNSKVKELPLNEIVLDDVIILNTGSQIVLDSLILDGKVEVNEAFITGEEESVFKKEGEKVLSGSFVVSGKCYAKVIHINEDNYTAQISKDAKYIKRINSELLNSLNKVIKVISFIIVPLGIVLFLKQVKIHASFNEAIISSVAAVMGMIPEGLVLLTSTVLAVAVIRLSKYKVLVQELYAIETLARIDTLCLDKTGTITTGNLELYAVNPLEGYPILKIHELLNAIAINSTDNSGTMLALKEKYAKPSKLLVNDIIPYSSDRKWSSYKIEDEYYVLGAPEFILTNLDLIKPYLTKYADGYRLLVLAKADKIDFEKITGAKAVAVILFQDTIRKNAKTIINFFLDEGVDLKIISGDSLLTTLSIAKKAGLKALGVDASKLSNEELKKATLKYNVFGRVTPQQKKLMIETLKENGHTVGMTGDGVNDVLALKSSDCSIALASGSDASKAVANFVLLNSDFASLLPILNEGRKTINNIERSASLFLEKTVFATILSIAFIFLNLKYPFMPIQLTLISVATIGIPSFILALEPNYDKNKGNFLTSVLTKALPGGITIALNILVILLVGELFKLNEADVKTLAVYATSFVSFLYLAKVCMPWNKLRISLYAVLVIFYLLQVIFLKEFYGLVSLSFINFIWLCLFIVLATSVFYLLSNFGKKHNR